MTRRWNWRLLTIIAAVACVPLGGVWLQMATAQTGLVPAGEKADDPVPRARPGAARPPAAVRKAKTKAAGTGMGMPGMGGMMGPMMGGARGAPMGSGGMGMMMGGAGPIDPAVQAEQEAIAEQENETRRLLDEYAQTEDEKERAWVAGELTKAVAKQFDLRQEARDRELKQLEDQVRRLRELHQKREKQKEQIVQDRVRQLLNDVDGLGWGVEEGGPASGGYNGPATR